MNDSVDDPCRAIPKVVLASTSPYRKQLLARLRIAFEAVDSGIDETRFKALALPPSELVRILAEQKAQAVGHHHPNSLIVGGDQCVELDGRVLGKAGTNQGAMGQLRLLSGRTHHLFTALSLLDTRSGRCDTVVDVHEMTMRPLNPRQIERYVQIDEPLDCAGSYKLESLGIALFDRVQGDDPTAIIGLPLMRLVSLLATAGYDVFARAGSDARKA
ncbi:MAG TPA: nucleoside triphosphate pyrophosphatase [Polyangiaceae bacterium]|jgi:septum formation protein|nr:MAG: Maf-like protein YceF [Deltaproteobacteria bacterium ADurb.Bin207]HNS99634.1 nucleoside triphosphate pyrophosphatase [Polyangiaceae bacterium]HNZ22008.1 nucleoside triphosphate pyrophosphatase [Polyangiaceae bacterium]HOD25038.1 nucleoside triphosphate pyrophosphatase [Polyangiaceae bacterium]HOE47316.1 nucleoside triphosphate pyrophosphatase [Polyangiaceae bacterium]